MILESYLQPSVGLYAFGTGAVVLMYTNDLQHCCALEASQAVSQQRLYSSCLAFTAHLETIHHPCHQNLQPHVNHRREHRKRKPHALPFMEQPAVGHDHGDAHAVPS